jgi:succinate-semialdehyde dehydrogenase/glutarate-semialdehyde dehydrogenase
MPYMSLNPATNRVIQTYASWEAGRLEQALETSHNAQQTWAQTPFVQRAEVLRKVAMHLHTQRDRYASLITLEMGKLQREARAEVEKCAGVCDYYAQHAEKFLHTEPVESDAGISYVAYYPLGVLLAVMPWNFPLAGFSRRRPGLDGGQCGGVEACIECAAVRARTGNNLQ